MPYDPINQIKTLAAHTVSTYDSVGGQSYVTGLAAARDAKAIIDVVDHMLFITLYQCDECGYIMEDEDPEHTQGCGGSVMPMQVISKRRKR